MVRLFLSLLLAVSAWSAEKVDWICTGRYVVTMDAQRRVIENGAVAIRADRIVAVGPRADIDTRYEAARRLDRPEALLAPGLVNTHAHVPMSLLRGVADDLRLQDWLEKYIFPAEAKNVSADFVRWGTRLGCLEMLLSGVTTYADMYYFEDVVAEETRAAGMRGVLGETVLTFPAPDFKTPQQTLAFTEKFIQRFRHDALIVPTVAPHALYTNTPETLRASRALADKYGVPLIIHVAETKQERAKSGRSPVAELEELGVFNGPTLAAHSVWVDEADLAILKRRGVGIAHCPSSNMKLASGVAPVTRMLALDLAVGLGTDGPAGSNNDFNLFEEMDLAAKLQKVTTGDPRSVSAQEAFEMATARGARALGMEREIGSLENGKRADLISVQLSEPHAVPLFNVYSQLVYALKASDVADVMVNGRLLIEKRQALTLDRASILAKAREFGSKIGASLR